MANVVELISLDDMVEMHQEVARLAAIGDYEQAHGVEDHLRTLALAAVAGGHPQSEQIAVVALATGDVRYPRWCA